MSARVTVVEHPLVQHKLTLMRKKDTPTGVFRALLRETAMLLAYEAFRDLPLAAERIETPLATMDAPVLSGRKLVLVSVLRAGDGLLDGILEIIPAARVGYIGLYRHPGTLEAVEYYCKLPTEMSDRDVVIVDPMLATGHSAVAAIDRIKGTHPRSVKFLCLIATPEGIAHLRERHPDVPLITAAIDQRLDEHAHIIPGLGDAGDRLFGTK